MRMQCCASSVIMMIIISIISSIYLGVSITIIRSFRQYGDIFDRERSLSIYNIIVSALGIIIGVFGLIIVMIGRAALNKVAAVGCVLLGLCAFVSLIIALVINYYAIDCASSRITNNMKSYLSSSYSKNIIDSIQTQYDCCGDNVWLDWSRMPLDATSSGTNGMTMPNSLFTPMTPIGLNLGPASSVSSTTTKWNMVPVGNPQPQTNTNTDTGASVGGFSGNRQQSFKKHTSTSTTASSGFEQDRRRKRLTQVNYGNIYGLPLTYGLTLPRSCCGSDAATTSGSLDSYCISNANHVPNSIRIDGCTKKISRAAIGQTFIIILIDSVLLVFALVAIPIINSIHSVYSLPSNTYRKSSQMRQLTNVYGGEHIFDDKARVSVVNPNADYSIFQ